MNKLSKIISLFRQQHLNKITIWNKNKYEQVASYMQLNCILWIDNSNTKINYIMELGKCGSILIYTIKTLHCCAVYDTRVCYIKYTVTLCSFNKKWVFF